MATQIGIHITHTLVMKSGTNEEERDKNISNRRNKES